MVHQCVFAAPSLEILRHTILATGTAPTADHATEIKNCPPPQDIKQLQRFLGMVNFLLPFFAQLCSSFETAAQKHSVCWAAHPSNWLVTFPPAFSAQLFP
jgi:hypothetical protein